MPIVYDRKKYLAAKADQRQRLLEQRAIERRARQAVIEERRTRSAAYEPKSQGRSSNLVGDIHGAKKERWQKTLDW